MSDRTPFIEPAEIMEMLGVAKSKAYKIIKDLNKELEEQGYYTLRGKTNRDYFEERFKINSGANNGRQV